MSDLRQPDQMREACAQIVDSTHGYNDAAAFQIRALEIPAALAPEPAASMGPPYPLGASCATCHGEGIPANLGGPCACGAPAKPEENEAPPIGSAWHPSKRVRDAREAFYKAARLSFDHPHDEDLCSAAEYRHADLLAVEGGT